MIITASEHVVALPAPPANLANWLRASDSGKQPLLRHSDTSQPSFELFERRMCFLSWFVDSFRPQGRTLMSGEKKK